MGGSTKPAEKRLVVRGPGPNVDSDNNITGFPCTQNAIKLGGSSSVHGWLWSEKK
jgi:hypothetical protein